MPTLEAMQSAEAHNLASDAGREFGSAATANMVDLDEVRLDLGDQLEIEAAAILEPPSPQALREIYNCVWYGPERKQYTHTLSFVSESAELPGPARVGR